MGPGIQPGTEKQVNPHGFGQRAKKATLTDVEQTAWATTAGTFKLSNLSLKLHKGVEECF
ncbi:Cholesterol esterase OS=Streptomyces microflavus OX=1919 GN=Smic_57860 PE=4 SV=1 [Streptomyces microflavus]